MRAKGKSEPIPVWEALAARARFGVDVQQSGGAPLVGRREELDLLSDALGRAQRERTPQLLTLVGVPGIGKSRLVWELAQAVDADPELIVFWRQGRSLPYGEGVAFWARGGDGQGPGGDPGDRLRRGGRDQASRDCRGPRPGSSGRALDRESSAPARGLDRGGRCGRGPPRRGLRAPGAASSRRSPSGAPWCSSSRISTGPTTICSTSSTTSSTG